MGYRCLCCGYLTLPVPDKEAAGYICPVCFWENDIFLRKHTHRSVCNSSMTLLEGEKNFIKFGACQERLVQYVREPKEEEIPPYYS